MIASLTLLAAFAAPPNLVVVSLDTTRADALSAYGPPGVDVYDATPDLPRTPFLDGIAESGVRFERFYAQSPSTLASHATLFTGLDPHQTMVARNGFTLPANVETLAERLTEAGYDTRAVLGAAALEGGTGIEQGFSVWDDESPTLRGLMFQSPADEVVRRTLATVDARPADKPLFLFVHFFDAHSPYEPPVAFRERFAEPNYQGPYAEPESKPRMVARALRAGKDMAVHVRAINGRYYAELTWLDTQIEALVKGLEAAGVLDDALLVVVGDHGEVLSERPKYAWSHGNDVSEGVTHVPLLMKAYGSVPLARKAVVKRQAGMASLASTMEVALGLEPRLGRPVWDLVRPGPVLDVDGWPAPTQSVFQEATRPRQRENLDGWNNLPFERVVLAGGASVSAFPMLRQRGRLLTGEPALKDTLVQMLADWDAAAPPHQSADMAEHQIKALKALGYLSDDP